MGPMSSPIDQVEIGVVVALALEAAPLRDRLAGAIRLRAADHRITVGSLGGRSIAVIEGGVGRIAAQRATQVLIDGHRPQRIIAAGLCGGLAPAITRATVITPHSIGRAGTGEIRRLPRLPPDSGAPPDATTGLLVTTETMVVSPADKRALHDASGAVAVDMESWWIADVAARAGLPCHVVRSVSDAAGDAIAPDVASLAGITSPARQAGAAMRLVWRRPSAVGELAELREHAHRAADALAEHVSRLLLREPVERE